VNTNINMTRSTLHRTVERCVTILQAPTFVGVAFALLLSPLLTTAASSSGMNADRLAALSNNARVEARAPMLRMDPLLSQSASSRAQELIESGVLSHARPNGSPFSTSIAQKGYPYAVVGENIGVHFTDEQSLVRAWLESPLHAKNMLNRKFSDIGVAVAAGTVNGVQTIVVVQHFGEPLEQPTLSIENALPLA